MAAIQRGPKLDDPQRMIYPLSPAYKARLEAISLRQAKSVAWITTEAMMELIDRLDPVQAAPSKPKAEKKAKSGKKASQPLAD